jgi:hypothetical protein
MEGGPRVQRFLTLNRKVAFAVYVVADLVCVAMGMGVPIFCIALGFLVGCYIAMRAISGASNVQQVLRSVLLHAVATSLVTFVVMAVLWGPTIAMLLDPTFEAANFGIPLILYDPTLSFIGWLLLMIFISPFLQLLTTLFSSYLTLSVVLKEESRAV